MQDRIRKNWMWAGAVQDPHGAFSGTIQKGPLTLHLSLGRLVQSHIKLHDWGQLNL